MNFDMTKNGASDYDVTEVKVNADQVEYWFDPKDLLENCIVISRDDAVALAKFYSVTQEEIEDWL